MPRVSKQSSIRQSVTLPRSLAAAVKRVAKERNLTMSRALVTLAQRGVQADAEARAQLEATYHTFLKESEPKRKNEVGKALIRAIFGKESIAEDSVR